MKPYLMGRNSKRPQKREDTMSQFDQIYDRRGTGSVKYDLLEAEG